MLIEFSVSNFRSFREKQTFSMVAAPRLRKKENLIAPSAIGETLPHLLKVAAVYGPNASGKSNLITALGLVNSVLTATSANTDTPFPVSPFRFDPNLVDKPSVFEIHFISEGQRYEFLLALTAERVIRERLIVFPKGKETLLYDRNHTPSGDEYTFGSLEGGPTIHDAWKKLTSPKALFISQAVTNSSEELQQLRIPITWLKESLKALPRDLKPLVDLAQSVGVLNPNFIASHVAPFLQELDIPVSGISFESKKNADDSKGAQDSMDAAKSKEDLQRAQFDAFGNTRTTLTHTSALGEAKFDIEEESDGTKNLFGFSLPWLVLSTLKPKTIAYVVDELDSSLHPKIVAALMAKLMKLDTQSQLIFTTHDTHLMDTKLLRRDQFWLTERDMNGATQLRSIHDFVGRESEDLEKRYYEGRYRSLPILR